MEGVRWVTRQVFLPQGGGAHGQRCKEFLDEVRCLLRESRAEAVAYELPPSLRGYHATRVLFGLEAVLLAEVEAQGVAYREVRAMDGKRALCGDVRATKIAMVAAACARLDRAWVSEDEADALGVLLAVEGCGPAEWGVTSGG